MMKNNKLFVLGIVAFTFILTSALAGCSNAMTDNSIKGIPSELRNTVWTKQIDTETVTLAFGARSMTVSNADNPEWNDEWDFDSPGYAGCCGNRFSNSLDFQYICDGNTLCITGCNGRRSYLNGDWIRESR